VERLARKARKIRKRLGASPDFLQPIRFCPSGMQEKTFQRLRAKELPIERQRSRVKFPPFRNNSFF
jgi:hypothetical protein